jgi:cation diffusion facilitator CzcD-associated flavoprotein CzcO
MSPKTLTIHTDGRVPIPSVCIIGAGMSGLCTAIQLKRKLGLDNFVIFEKAKDVGGAWLSNSYPGCQVDVPAWLYSFSFEQNPGT